MEAILILALSITAFVLYLISSSLKPANFPPGPARLPFVGNTLLIKNLSRKLGGQYKALLKLSADYKTNILGLKLGSDQYVVVFGRKLVQQVFTKEEFQGRPDGFFLRLRTMGQRRGITMTDGPLWQEQRNFAERQLRQLGFGKIEMESLMKDEICAMCSQLGDNKDEVSLNRILSECFLNVLWTICGGKHFSKEQGRLDDLLSLLKERSKAFDMAGGILNQLPWIRFFFPNYSGYNCIKSLNSKLFDLFQEIIDDHKRTVTANETRDFVDAYLQEKSKTNSVHFTDQQLVAVCLDFFIAGALTTSYTLDFAILALINNPRCQQKLQEEIDNVVPKGQIPALSDKARLPYVEAVLQESSRFQHVVPTAGPRRTLHDTTLDGYRVPKNTIILMSLRSVHYDEKRWKDPEVFRPERFIDDKGEFVPDEGLCPFGLGKRRCPGEVPAKNFVFLAFVTLFQKYRVSFPEGKRPSSDLPGAGILLTPQPYTVTLESRS